MEQDQLIVISGRTEPFTYQTLNAAINYAVKVYSGETLEDSLIPYIVHPFEVMNTLSFMGAGMALMAAGVLHDVVENKKVELEKIAEMFGKEISDLVAFQTDYNKDLPWKERKGITLKLLEKASQREKMLVLADELSNIEAMARCYEQWRDEFYWEIYQKNREEYEWYYRGLEKVLGELWLHHQYEHFYNRFVGAVDYIFSMEKREDYFCTQWEG